MAAHSGPLSTVVSVQADQPVGGWPAWLREIAAAVNVLGQTAGNQLADTGVIAGSYTNTNLTVAVDGRITAASNGSGGVGGGTVTSVAAGTGLVATPSPIVGAGTLALTVPVAVANGGTGATTAPTALTSLGAASAADLTTETAARIAADALLAPLASPTFTGDPRAPTPLTADNDTSIATTAFVKAQSYLTANQTITLSGDIAGSGTTAIATTLPNVNSNVGTFASHTVNAKGLTTAAGNLTGDVTTSGAAATIANGAVTYAKQQNVTAARLIGNPTGSAAVHSEISLGTNLSFAGSVLNAAGGGGLSGMTAGQIPIAATATTVTGSGNLSGDVVSTATLATTIQANAVTTTKINNAAVTYAKIQNVAANRLLGNATGSAAAPSEIALPLAVANGGTGATNFPVASGSPAALAFANSLLLGSGTGAVISSPYWSNGGATGQAGSLAAYVCDPTNYGFLDFGRAMGSAGTPTATASAATMGAVFFEGYSGSAWAAGVTILAEAAQNWTGSLQGTNLRIATTATGSATHTTRLTINAGLLVGTATGGDKGAGTLNATAVYANGTLLTSDVALKTDIEPLGVACLPLVEAVEPKSYRWREVEGPPSFAEGRHSGFLAQDLAGAAPGLVDGEPGDMAVDTGALVAVLWQAVRELSAKVAALERA